MTFPRTADVVIIGGGIIGTSIAFYLSRMGAGQVVLLERKHLTAGATGTSSGMVRQYAANSLDAQIVAKSIETFQYFDDLEGGDCGWVRTGLLYLVPPSGLESMKANISMLQGLGLSASLVTAEDLHQLAPYLAADEPFFGAYDPVAGYADPYSTTMGFAGGARRYGARIFPETPMTGIVMRSGRVAGVYTPQGEIVSPIVVNAAGPWAGLVAAMAGVPTDLTPECHQVGSVQAPPEATWPHLSVIDAQKYIYFRSETGRLTLIGASFANRTVSANQLDSYCPNLTDETQYTLLERFCARFPSMEMAGVRKGQAGVYISTADGRGMLGPSPGVEGFYQAIGLGDQGFKMAPALGQAMSELIMKGRAETVDLAPLRVTRFGEGNPVK